MTVFTEYNVKESIFRHRHRDISNSFLAVNTIQYTAFDINKLKTAPTASGNRG